MVYALDSAAFTKKIRQRLGGDDKKVRRYRGPNTVVFDFEPRGQRKFDEQYVEIETLSVKELEFSTMAPPGGGWYSSFVYRRAE
jgi:hypothetical protein